MNRTRAILWLLLLLIGGFSLALLLQPRAAGWTNRSSSDSLAKVVFGESRRLFANHFYTKADLSFHRGYYLTFWDQARKAREEEAREAAGKSGHEEPGHDHAAPPDDHQHEPGAGHQEEPGHDEAHQGHVSHESEGILGPPTDWIDRFGRRFRITEHTELSGREAREILPWLRVSADLDPQRIETYTVAAYWLSEHLGKADEAEQFLREGLKANPNSYEILFEIGQIYENHRHQPDRAKNVWLLAVRRWQETESSKEEPDFAGYNQIVMNIARLEEKRENFAEAIAWMEKAKPHSPDADALQKHIDTLRAGPRPPGN